MKQAIFIFMAITFVVLMVGYTKPEESKVPLVKPYSVELTVGSRTLYVGETFYANATLFHRGDKEDLTYNSNLFNFIIWKTTGETYECPGALGDKVHTIDKDEGLIDTCRHVFDTPGTYSITATVEFSTPTGEYMYIYSPEPVRLKVLPQERNVITSNLSVDKAEAVVGEKIVATATLKNQGPLLDLTTGGSVFYFSAKDSSGKPVNSYAVTMIGIMRKLAENGSLSSTYGYVFNHPGTYTAFSSYSAKQLGSGNFESKTQEITVTVKGKE
jgi:hypothetical protein